MRTTNRFVPNAAFSLLEIAVILVVAGAVIATTLTFGGNLIEDRTRTANADRTELLNEALRSFYALNNRLPCPANEQLSPGDANYGVEQFNGTNCDFDIFGTADADAGAIPVRTLGLPDEMMIDEYNNLFTYVVDTEMVNTSTAPFAVGSITIDDATVETPSNEYVTENALYFIASHGPGGVGAVSKDNPATARDCTGSGRDSENCNSGDNIFVQTRFNDGDVAADNFDDVAHWGSHETLLTATANTIADDCEDGNNTLMRVSATNAGQTCDNGTWSDNDICDGDNPNAIYYDGTQIRYCSGASFADCTANLNWSVGANSCSGGSAPPNTHHGETVSAIDSLADPNTGAATLRCNNGSWVAESASCVPAAPPADCTGTPCGTIAHGATCTAYQNSTEPFGGSCTSETRTCTNGALSGSYTNASCTVSGGANCTGTPCGTIAHGATCTAYQNSTEPFGGSCTSETRTCTNGALSGSYTNASCTVSGGANCTGTPCGTIAHGATCTAYQNSTEPFGGSCTSETRTCTNGALSGSYTNASCTVSGGANCTGTPCGTIAHGATCTAYQNSTEPFGGSCTSETRTCTNGALSGSYTNASCSVSSPASCSSPCGTIAHGATCTAYLNSSEPYGGSCSSETRTCNNGVLSGSYTHTSCSVNPAAGCSSPCGAIPHGGSCTAYDVPYTSFPVSCLSESRVCNNGSLSGSYTNVACIGSFGAGADCTGTTGSWTVGGKTCYGTLPNTASGEFRSVSDGIGPNTGSASFSCTNGTWSAPYSTVCN
jgi:type II secretory pathway pseudopilin PulG